MRKATVVYLTGAESITESFEEMNALQGLGLQSDWATFVASDVEVQEATRRFVERGAVTVEAIKGKVDLEGKVEVFGEPLRILG